MSPKAALARILVGASPKAALTPVPLPPKKLSRKELLAQSSAALKQVQDDLHATADAFQRDELSLEDLAE